MRLAPRRSPSSVRASAVGETIRVMEIRNLAPAGDRLLDDGPGDDPCWDVVIWAVGFWVSWVSAIGGRSTGVTMPRVEIPRPPAEGRA